MKNKCLFFLLLASLGFIFILGKCLDMEAIRIVKQLYVRNSQGIIIGDESIKMTKHGHQNAIIFIHGFLNSPREFLEIMNKMNGHIDADMYAPLLPYHGRDLSAAAKLNNKDISQFVESSLVEWSKRYQSLTVVAHSYGAAILSQLSIQHRLPKNIHIILYAPAIHISVNTQENRIRNFFYRLWRNYCNYALLGCEVSYDSGDAYAKIKIEEERSMLYKIASSVQQLFALDLALRGQLAKMDRPFSIIIAKDDNRISYDAIASECKGDNQQCRLYTFENGSHMIHYGYHQDQFIELIQQINDSYR